jgi:hypothetical protein
MKPFAEIIESNLNSWCGKNWAWDNIPSFGSIVSVKTKSRTIYSVIYNIQIGSSDPNRTVMTYQKTEEELKREQPQIFEFLETKFNCVTIAYKENDLIFYQVAPEPPKIHDFVWPITVDERNAILSNEQYLQVLFNYTDSGFLLDELLLAILKFSSDQKTLKSVIFEKFIKMFSLLTNNDYRRLKLFLQRAKNIIKVS